MKQLGFERISDDTEFVAGRVVVDNFEGVMARLMESRRLILTVARGHRRAEIEYQRVNPSVPHRGRAHPVQAGYREGQRRQRRHLEPEERVEPNMADTRDRRGGLIEEHETRHLEGGPRARAQIDQHQQREAECVYEVLRTQETHGYLTIPSSGRSRSMKSSNVPAPNACT